MRLNTIGKADAETLQPVDEYGATKEPIYPSGGGGGEYVEDNTYIKVKGEPGLEPITYEMPVLQADPGSIAPAGTGDKAQGYIYVTGDVLHSNGKPLASYLLEMKDRTTGEIIATDNNQGSGYYAGVQPEDVNDIMLIFSAPGYQTKTFTVAQLLAQKSQQGNANVVLSKKFPIAIIIAVMAAVALYRKKNKKVGALTTSDIWPIFLLVGGAIGFGIVKDVLEFIGLWDSKDTKDLDNAATNPNSFWNPNFWQNKPANVPWTYLIDRTTADKWAKDMHSMFGPFNDDEDGAIAVAKRCRTQSNFSFLAYAFQAMYNQDMLTYLRGGSWPEDNLSDADVNTINNYIANLPKY